MKWTTKATAQQLLNHVPGGDRLYYGLQRLSGGLRHFQIEARVKQGQRLLTALEAIGEGIAGRRTMEIGTGWAPILPLYYFLQGQSRCDTYDISRLLSTSLTDSTVRQLLELSASDVTLGGENTARRQELQKFFDAGYQGKDLLLRCGIDYHAPADAGRTSLADQSVDIVFSNVVMEHIPIRTVHDLFEESHRVLRPHGCMVHLIDLSDHFSHNRAHDDISSIHFLRYSQQEYDRYNTRFMYQNRLRPPTWRDLIVHHGFKIESWNTQVDSQSLNRYSEYPLDAAFTGFSPEENCTRNILVTARRI